MLVSVFLNTVVLTASICSSYLFANTKTHLHISLISTSIKPTKEFFIGDNGSFSTVLRSNFESRWTNIPMFYSFTQIRNECN